MKSKAHGAIALNYLNARCNMAIEMWRNREDGPTSEAETCSGEFWSEKMKMGNHLFKQVRYCLYLLLIFFVFQFFFFQNSVVWWGWALSSRSFNVKLQWSFRNWALSVRGKEIRKWLQRIEGDDFQTPLKWWWRCDFIVVRFRINVA